MPDQRWLSSAEARAWRSYLTSNTLLMRELDRQLVRDSGLAHTHFGILVQLSERPGGSARITELAGLMEHSQSRTSHAVTRLVENGWVRRELAADDRRVVYAVLTDQGRAVLASAAPGHVRCVRENVFDAITPEQMAGFQAVCDAMIERLTGQPVPVDGVPDIMELDRSRRARD